MRLAVTTIFACAAVVLSAQAPAPPQKLFASGADVAAMMAKAKNERKPDQPNFIQPIIVDGAYRANLEYRVHGIDTNPNNHEQQDELVYVVEGAGKLTTGGKLRDEKRINPTNLTGSSLEGGTSRLIAKGDYIMILANTPHAFTDVEGTLVIMSLHIPAANATK